MVYNPSMPSTTFKTLDTAISELRSKGMLVSNPKDAKHYLDCFSVYSVINGYADIFNDSLRPGYFLAGASFSELKAVHHFDEGLRRCLTHNVLRIESIVKSRATYQFCDAKDAMGNPKRGSCDYLLSTSYDSTQLAKAKN